jgi:deoxyadenosine/deoxycytidine kinase
MGKLICVVGNSGVGKTSLTRHLCQIGPFITGLEQHDERPFQRLFSADHQRYSLANQVDYLLFRAEQELAIRESPADGIVDGGLDMDYTVFTRHFFNQGYLDEAEYLLCQRTYRVLRRLLPPPEVIIRLVAPIQTIAERFARRKRRLEIATLADLEAMEGLLEDWLGKETLVPAITVDASVEDPDYATIGEGLLAKIHAIIR